MRDDKFYQELMSIANGHSRAADILVGYSLVCHSSGLPKGVQTMKNYNLTGQRLVKLHDEVCKKDINEFIRTIHVLGEAVYLQEEIDAGLEYAVGFIDGSVKLSWDDLDKLNKCNAEFISVYAKNNAKICKPRLQLIASQNQAQNEIGNE